MIRKPLRAPLALALLVASGCSDLATESNRQPSELQLDRDSVLVTVGDETPFGISVFDQNGQPFDHVPGFADVVWSSSNGSILRVNGQELRAVGPGEARATVELAGLSARAVVRVNPRQLRLNVDSVQLYQGSVPASTILTPGRDANLLVYVSGDQPNFFNPAVRVLVVNGADTLYAQDVRRNGESVPREGSWIDPADTWRTTIPGSAITQGASLVVQADPEQTITRAAGSRDRYPHSGSGWALPFGITLHVQALHVTQSVQNFAGTIPLVAGRDGLLRVFVTSDLTGPYRPVMRATFYRNGAPVHTVDMRRDTDGVPQDIDQGLLGRSWNARIPASLLQPGLGVVIEADPAGDVPLTSESTVRLPASGVMQLDVRAVPKHWGRVVPVHQTAFGTTGRVDESNLEDFTRPLLAKFPIAEFDFDIRAPYSTDARLDTQNGWSQLLREIWALRAADGSSRYYYGVHTNPPNAIWGGLGYVGWPAAIGYDAPRFGAETMAHELGHNFALPHAPCGNPSGVDPAFPYLDGGIGEIGFDIYLGRLMNPGSYKDLMTYCSPEWISDYNYMRVFNFRDQNDWDGTGPDASRGAEPAILVWGGVEDGRLVLEPAFELEMRPQMPRGGGPYRIEGYDEAGTLLFGYSFQAAQIDHSANSRGFSFAIPTRLASADRLARLRLVGPEGSVQIGRTAEAAQRSQEVRSRADGRELRLSWKREGHPMALVRDAATGQILSFARSGEARVQARGRPVEVLLSDGIRTTKKQIRPF